MTSRAMRISTLLILIIFASGALPLALYQFSVGDVPTIDAREAKELLNKKDSRVILVDVRSPGAFESVHLEAALNWPYKEIMALESETDIPSQFEGKTILMICDSGLESAIAAKKLRDISTEAAYSIKGGMQDWIGTPGAPCPAGFCKLRMGSGQIESFPFQESSLFEQWMACIAAFGAKPIYMLLSAALAIIIRRLKSPDLVALRWAFVFFFIGEGFCAINYLFLSEASYLVEYLHSFGMVVAFGFTTFALLEGIDLRLIKYTPPNEKCAGLVLCGSCIKYTNVPCGFKRMFLWLIPSFIILSFIPLLASLHSVSYNTNILGTIYNYSHPVIFQIFEIRYAPAAAIIFFLLSFVFLRFKNVESVFFSKLFFAAGMGFFGFSMFRLILFGLYRDNLVWYVCWEEFTELLYIALAGIFLWIFRERLFSNNFPNSSA